MTTLRTVDDIADDLIKAHDGGTFPVVVGQRVPVAGYVVGQHGVSGPTDTLDVRAWVESVRAEVAHKPGYYVGAWHFDGLTYLDVVRVFPELVPAMRDARDHGQIAIYDLTAEESLFLDGDGVREAA